MEEEPRTLFHIPLEVKLKNKMRVFISINLPESIKKEISRIQDSLPEFIGKKTEEANLHLTLKFLGEIDEKKVEEIKERLNKIEIDKFETAIDEIGIFSPQFIKIIWVHLKNCGELQKRIDEALSDIFDKEHRFMSHITIARVKKIKDKKRFLDDISKIKIKESKFIVDKFYLMKSELNPKGPIYRILGEFSLT
mgnify:CR=1 FL=1